MRGKKLGRPCSRQRRLAFVIRSVLNPLTFTASLSGLSLLSAAAFAGPTGGNIVGGTGSINTNNLTTTIQQNSAALAINWNSFNLDQNDIVNFIQPSASSIALNRILSSNGSQIHGKINANGHVILVNPNGIFFGATSSVNVGGLIASGLDINTEDFMNGKYVFQSVENTNGIVTNAGLLNASLGGSISLVGKQVINEGIISANLGAVNMAAGHEAVVTFDEAGYVGIKVTKEILQNELGIDPAILNSGNITANGGRILLTASQSQDLFSQAVNIGNIKQATSLVMHEDGSFTLGRGANVMNSGTLDVSTSEPHLNAGQITVLGENITSNGNILADAQQGQGGDIELHARDTTLLTENSLTSARAENNGSGGVIKVLGNKVGVFDHSVVDASGALGGGELYIGGGFQGSNSLLRNAQFSYVNKDAVLTADAGQQGDGGQIIVWADNSTQFYGTIAARGGNLLGDGGFAEVSGKQGLVFDGDVDLSASAGYNGTLLLDPKNITISTATTSDTFPDEYNAFADLSNQDTVLNNTDLSNRLAGTFVQLRANTDIHVQANVSGTNNLTLEAGRSITLSDGVAISLNGGNFSATINHGGARCDNDCNPPTVTNQRDSGPAEFTMGTNSSITTQGGAISITTGSFYNNGYQLGDMTLQALNSAGATNTNAGAISISNSILDSLGNVFGGNVIANGAITASGGVASGDAAGRNGGAVNVSGANVTLNTVDTRGSNASGVLDNSGGNGGNITINVTENNGTPSIVLNGNVLTAGGTAVNDAVAPDDGIAGTAGTVAISLNGSAASGNATIVYANDFSTAFTITNNTLGTDRYIQAANRSNSWAYNTTVTLNGMTFSGFDALRGSAGNLGNDIFTLSADFAGTISGGDGIGVDTLSRSGGNTWNINTNNGGTLGSTTFSGIENLTGGNGSDTFNFGANISGTVLGGADDDIFNITVADVVIGDIQGGNNNSGGDTLAVLLNTPNVWDITSDNSGTLNTNTPFSGIENLTGGDGVDTFNMAANISGTVAGGAGDDAFNIMAANNLTLTLAGGDDVDTLTGFNRNNDWSIAGDNGGTLNTATVFSAIENLTGNNNLDAFIFTNNLASLSGLINGGTAGDLNLDGVEDVTDSVNYSNISTAVSITLGQHILNIESIIGNNNNSTLVGTDAGHTWNITNVNTGNVDNQVRFSGFNNLVGRTGNDHFVFENTQSRMSGQIIGGNGTGVDTADYRQINNVTVNLGSSLDGIDGVEILQGNNLNATLVAENESNTWTIDTSNSGNVQNDNGRVTFSGFNNLTGGDQDDTFDVSAGGQVTGQIVGMAGDDIVNVVFTGSETGLIDFDGGDHNTNGDSILLTGGGTDYAVTYDSNVLGADQLTYNANGNLYTVRYVNTEQVDDAVTATSLTLNGTAGNDVIELGNAQFAVNTSTTVDFSNKTNLIVDALAGNDVMDIADDANFTGDVTLTAETLTNSNGVLTANSLLLNNVLNVGTVVDPFATQINQLRLQNISGAVYLNEADALILAELGDINATLNVQARGDISQSTAFTTAANLSLTSNTGQVTLDAANALTGVLSLAGSNVRLTNLADTQLGNVNAQVLNVDVTGNLTDMDGAVIAITGASDLRASGDIVLDGVNGASTHQLGDITATAHNVTLSAGTLSIGRITADAVITLQSNAQITDANAASENLIADRVQLTAQTGIDIDTQAETLNIVNTISGEVDIENSATALLELVRNTGGDITFVNDQQVTIDRIEAAGHLDMTVGVGDFRGAGVTPPYTEADADIVAASADFLALRGSFGTVSRPIVAYIPGDITVFSRISFAPVFLPTDPLSRISDTSLLKFSALDALSSLAGEQVVEVESLNDVDPAIFTDVHNYNLSDISIRMPKDQLYDEELE